MVFSILDQTRQKMFSISTRSASTGIERCSQVGSSVFPCRRIRKAASWASTQAVARRAQSVVVRDENRQRGYGEKEDYTTNTTGEERRRITGKRRSERR
jgi:hypothetical protein